MSTAYATPKGDDIWMLAPNLLLVITDHACHLVKGSPIEIETLVRELVQEGIPAEVRLTNAKTIPFKKLMLICGDEKSLKLQVRYASLGAALTSHGVQTTDLEFGDVESMRGVADSFQRHFGPDGKCTRKELSPARALVVPAITTSIVGLVTWFLASSADHAEDFEATGRHRAAKELLGKLIAFLGPTGTAAVGILAMIGCLIWAVMRFKNPPILVRLKPGKSVKK